MSPDTPRRVSALVSATLALVVLAAFPGMDVVTLVRFPAASYV